MQGPTPTQRKIAAFVQRYWQLHGFGPSHQDIADEFGYSSTNAVRSHLALMKKKRLIEHVEGTARTIRVVGNVGLHGLASEAGIPLLGRIPAGIPFHALQENAERLPVSPGLFAGKQLFALRVVGHSMRDAGILDGDIAILNYQEEIANGQIGAVLIDEVATLKRVYAKADSVVLRAANPDFEDMVFKAGAEPRITVAGRLVGVVRTKYFAAA